MAEKQSLYELLGLTDKASPEDIRNAHEALRQELDAQPDSEEKHNRITILNGACNVLLDRQQRAGYDRRQRDRRRQGRRQTDISPSRPRWLGTALTLALLAGMGYPAWRYLTPPRAVEAPPQTATAVAPAPTLAASAASEKSAADTLAADIAAQLPLVAPTAGPSPQATSPSTAVSAKAPPRLPQESPPANSAQVIAESTYAILGGGGQGTGIAIDRDKLLTNCHVIAPNVHKGPLQAISAVTGAPTLITHAAFLVKEDACVAHAPGLNARPMPMRDAARLAPGTAIYSLGFAQGRLTYSTGTLVGVIQRSGQNYLVSTNYCDHGVSGGPLVDADGNLVGLTSGGTRDKRFCASLTAETARRVLDQTLIAIDGFPTDYLTNLLRRW